MSRHSVDADEDLDDRGRIAPHDLPHIMQCVSRMMSESRRLRRRYVRLLRGDPTNWMIGRARSRARRARWQVQNQIRVLGAHFCSYDMVTMPAAIYNQLARYGF
eukprot:COSAG05_NODE_910_length_6641_cov_27.153776_2_plen_104_part_00